MEQEAGQPQPPKRPIGVAFVVGVAGLLMLDGAVELFLQGHAVGRAWALLVLSVAFLVLAMLWGAKRI